MKKILLSLSISLMCGCSYINVTFPVGVIPTVTGNENQFEVHLIFDQGRKGLDSLVPLDGVQAVVPFGGSTVTSPTNTPNITKSTK